MAIKLYVGRPRHGKTYEVVSGPILDALRDGRRVVSNIAGLNYEECVKLLVEEGCDESELGELLAVTHEDVADPYFWRTDYDEANGTETVVQPGDFVALDEIWRFWKRRGELDPRVQNFIRMHGQMPHPETGFTIEIAIITQSPRDVNEFIRDIVEETYRMTKLTAVGKPNGYLVDVFNEGKTTKDAFSHTLPNRTYDARYFPLYQSHSQKKAGGADAVEKTTDERGNILKSPAMIWKARAALGGVVGGLALMGFLAWKYFPSSEPPPPSKSAGPSASAPVAQVPKDKPADRRAVGWIQPAGGPVLVVVDRGDDTKRLKVLVSPRDWYISKTRWSGRDDGELVLDTGGRAYRGNAAVGGLGGVKPPNIFGSSR